MTAETKVSSSFAEAEAQNEDTAFLANGIEKTVRDENIAIDRSIRHLLFQLPNMYKLLPTIFKKKT